MSEVLKTPMTGMFPLYSSFIKNCLGRFKTPSRKRPKLGEKRILGFIDKYGNMRFIAGIYCKSIRDKRKKGFSQVVDAESFVVNEEEGLKTFLPFEKVALIAEYVGNLDKSEEYLRNAMEKVEKVESESTAIEAEPFKPTEFEPARIIFLTNEKRGTWEERWLQARRKGIGGSDIGAIMGWNKYKGPATVWAEKTGKKKSAAKNFKMIAGIELEEPILKWMLNQKVEFIRNGNHYSFKPVIKQPEAMYQLKEEGFEHMLYNPDGIVKSALHPELGIGLLEVKTASPFSNAADDMKAGVVPMSYMAQMQWGMGIFGLKWGLLFFSVDNRDPEYIYVEFDEEVFNSMKKFAKAFWDEYVVTGVMPAASGADMELIDGQLAAKPELDDEIIELSDGFLMDTINAISSLKADKKRIEGELKSEEALLKQRLENLGQYGVGPYKVKIAKTNGRTTLDGKKVKMLAPDVYEKSLKQSEGSISMRITAPKGRANR